MNRIISSITIITSTIVQVISSMQHVKMYNFWSLKYDIQSMKVNLNALDFIWPYLTLIWPHLTSFDLIWPVEVSISWLNLKISVVIWAMTKTHWMSFSTYSIQHSKLENQDMSNGISRTVFSTQSPEHSIPKGKKPFEKNRLGTFSRWEGHEIHPVIKIRQKLRR